MKSGPALLAENLVRGMARREASALTSAAERLPDLAIRNVVCPCGSVTAEIAEGIDPVRTGRIWDLGTYTRPDALDHGLPVLTKLACEVLDNRSVLPVAEILLRYSDRPVRLRTRAVAMWGMTAGPVPGRRAEDSWSEQTLLPLLRRLNDEEAWWPAAPDPLWTGSPHRTLPVATRAMSSAFDVDEASFLGPHLDDPVLAELNKVYLHARRDAVLRIL
ncbi:hypothetical protein ABTY00_37755 [Streptomyces microflavus]|uniref:hypothetical protein n=1 Tax=Streptomyces microflavus TaxID=1919 RepID=UPI00333164DB